MNYEVNLHDNLRLTDSPPVPFSSYPTYYLDYVSDFKLTSGSAWQSNVRYFDLSQTTPSMALGKVTDASPGNYNVLLFNRPGILVNEQICKPGQTVSGISLTSDGVTPQVGDYVFIGQMFSQWQILSIAVPEDTSHVVSILMQVRAPSDSGRGNVLMSINLGSNPQSQGNVVLAPNGNDTVQFNVPASASITAMGQCEELYADYDVNFVYVDGTTKCRQMGKILLVGNAAAPARSVVCLGENLNLGESAGGIYD